MILTIAGANFSGANIGTNTNVGITLTKGNGVSGSKVSSLTLEKNQVVSTATVIATGLSLQTGYENLVVTVTMTGTGDVSRWFSNGTVTIPSETTITGNIKITASATAVSGSEEDILDQVAWGNLTYRDIFVTNNIAPNVNENNLLKSINNTIGFKQNYTENNRQVLIVESNTIPSSSDIIGNYVAFVDTYDNETTATSAYVLSEQTGLFTKNQTVYGACKVNITEVNSNNSDSKNRCGMSIGNNYDLSIAGRVTNGWETLCSYITVSDSTANLFLGSTGKALLTGYIALPVIIRGETFGSSKPTQEEFLQLYNTYCTEIIK
jgi:hypothetical protein